MKVTMFEKQELYSSALYLTLTYAEGTTQYTLNPKEYKDLDFDISEYIRSIVRHVDCDLDYETEYVNSFDRFVTFISEDYPNYTKDQIEIDFEIAWRLVFDMHYVFEDLSREYSIQ